MKGIKPKAEVPKEVKKDDPPTPKADVNDKQPKADPSPNMLTDQELIQLTGTLSKFMDREKAPSYLEIQKMEAPYKTFSETGGIPFVDTLVWTDWEYDQLSLKSMKMLLKETRKKYVEASGVELKDLVRVAKPEVPKEVGGQQSKTVTEQPKRKSIFGCAA